MMGKYRAEGNVRAYDKVILWITLVALLIAGAVYLQDHWIDRCHELGLRYPLLDFRLRRGVCRVLIHGYWYPAWVMPEEMLSEVNRGAQD